MLNSKEDIRNNVLDSILIVLFLLFVLSFGNHDSKDSVSGSKPDLSCEIVINQSDAIIITNAPLANNQKTWVSEIKYPEFKNQGKLIISENRKTDNQISIQKDSISKTGAIPFFTIRYHLFFPEKDDVPLMS